MAGWMVPRTAVITFEDSRERVYLKRHALVEEELGKILRSLEGAAEVTFLASVRNVYDIDAVVDEPGLSRAESVVLHVPTWILPNVVVMTANRVGRPLIVVTNLRSDSAGIVGMLASAGGLDQAGLFHRRVIGDGADEKVAAKMLSYMRAASVKARLWGSTFGLIGGRSLGMYTATADASYWQKAFGVDTEHVDQLEIVRRAEAADAAKVAFHLKWLLDRVGHVEYEEGRFTLAHLERQIRVYLAAKDVIGEKKMDFAGLKCQTELSDGYVLGCVAAALLNDPYDAEGPKAPVPVSCEADCDGALTMMLLNLLSGGEPTALMDVKILEPEAGLFAFSNCGGMATWFATRAFSPEANLAAVHLRSHIFGEAGGAATQYVAAPGPVTLARLCRKSGRYWMAAFRGEVIKRPREELKKVVWPWPHMFVSTGIDLDQFLGSFGSNHMHVATGDRMAELLETCALLGVDFRAY